MMKLILKSSTNMEDIENNTVDLIITSPPYGKLKDYSQDANQIGMYEGDTAISMLSRVFLECYRVMKDGAFICINIGEYCDIKGFLYPFQAKLTLMMIDLGFKYFRNITWNKKTRTWQLIGKGPYLYFLATEPILIFRKCEFYELSDDEKTNKIKEIETLLKLNVWDIEPYNKKEDEHIAIYPEELVKRLILIYSKEGDIVLDPFTGSGTTLKVANELKRNSIGYEICKEFKNQITNKICAYQTNLFGEKPDFTLIE